MVSGGEADSAMRRALPRLSYAAYAGDLATVRECLHLGDNIHESVRLINQNNQDVLGATPLYLAAQMGHYDVCKALLRAGADVMMPCTIPATGQHFIPADIALMHFHLRTWWLLKEAKQKVTGKGGLKNVFRLKSKSKAEMDRVMSEKLMPAGSQSSAAVILTSGAHMAI